MAEQDEPPISDDALYQILTDALPVEFIGEDYFEEFILEGDSLVSLGHSLGDFPSDTLYVGLNPSQIPDYAV